jgi:WD40 repeat protein
VREKKCGAPYNLKEVKNHKFYAFFKKTIDGYIHPRHLVISDPIVQRLEKSHTLTGHDGCVNRIRWNPTGNKLVSGSDDRKV